MITPEQPAEWRKDAEKDARKRAELRAEYDELRAKYDELRAAEKDNRDDWDDRDVTTGHVPSLDERPSVMLNLTYGDHGKMLVLLWHDDSPGTKFVTRPGWLRRLGIVRSPFATSGETRRHYRELAAKEAAS